MANMIFAISLASIIVYATAGDTVVIGILGSSVSIECSLPLSDTLVWEDSNGNIIAMHGIVSGSVSRKYVIEKQNGVREILVIHDLTLADEERYRCYNLNNKTVTEVSKLNVLVKPPLMRVTHPEEPALEGTEVTLVCEADGGKPLPEISWHRIDAPGATSEVFGIVHDVVYVNGTGNRRHSLTVNVTRDTYMTSYVCNISVSVFYHRSLKVDLNVQLMPQQPFITGYHGGYDVGKVMTLECTSTGSTPTATIFWLQDNVRVGNYEFVVIPEGNGTLTVKSFFKRTMSRDFNASVLTCAVTNVVLEKQGLAPRMTNLTLLASYKPTIAISVRNHTSSEGSDVTLECHIDARPAPGLDALAWLHNGRVVNRDLYLMPTGTNGFRLKLTNLSRSDSGQYSCEAANRLGVSSSDPLSLTVLYAPVCTAASVVKQAVRVGGSVRLLCPMQAFPSNVTLLWRYQDSNKVINSFPATGDSNKGDIVYGTLDLQIKSQSQYTHISCFGINAIGQGHSQCVYEIVPPGTPEPPTNCSISSTGRNVSVMCWPGFNGGSRQHFMLQQLSEKGYKALVNSSLPAFTFGSARNVTVRVCAVNKDFGHVISCAASLTGIVKTADVPRREPVAARKGNTTAYIAGGVIAFVGLLITTALVIVLVRRQQKQCRKSELPTSLEDIAKYAQKQQEKQNKAKKWIKSIWRAIRFTSEPRGKARQSFKFVRRCEVVTNIDDSDDDITYQRVEVVASTPYMTLKQKHIHSEEMDMTTLSTFPKELQPKRTTDGELGILHSSTGFCVSPISTHSENSAMLRNKDFDNQRSRDDHTDAEFGQAYCTADIMDILDDTKPTHIIGRLEFTAKNDDTVDDGLVTRNKEYSAGDIFGVLNECEPNRSIIQQTNSRTIETSLPGSFNELTVQSWKVSSSTDISKLNFLENGSHITPNSSSSFCDGNGADFKSNTAIDNGCKNAKAKSLSKVYSLPNRLKKQKQKPLVKIISIPDIRTISNDDITIMSTLTCGFYGDYFPTRSSRKCSISGSESVIFSSAKDQETTARSNTRSSKYSVFTDAEDTICDLDEYTLTITSDANTDCCSADVLSVGDSFFEIEKLKSDLDGASQANTEDTINVKPARQNTDQPGQHCLRRNSFLSAISNSKCDSMADTSTNVLFCPDSEMEQSYFNEGFELEDNGNARSGSNTTGEHQGPDCSGINVVAYF